MFGFENGSVFQRGSQVLSPERGGGTTNPLGRPPRASLDVFYSIIFYACAGCVRGQWPVFLPLYVFFAGTRVHVWMRSGRILCKP
jgi:hypothetical protein